MERRSFCAQGSTRRIPLKMTLGPAWRHTAVLMLTKFGRAASANGSGGTDHGTASAVFVAGGAIRGRRVIAGWPGLGLQALHEARDLRPTLDMQALFKAALAAPARAGPGAHLMPTAVQCVRSRVS